MLAGKHLRSTLQPSDTKQTQRPGVSQRLILAALHCLAQNTKGMRFACFLLLAQLSEAHICVYLQPHAWGSFEAALMLPERARSHRCLYCVEGRRAVTHHSLPVVPVAWGWAEVSAWPRPRLSPLFKGCLKAASVSLPPP